MNATTKKEALLIAYEKALKDAEDVRVAEMQFRLECERERVQAELHQREHARAFEARVGQARVAVAEARAALLANVQDTSD